MPLYLYLFLEVFAIEAVGAGTYGITNKFILLLLRSDTVAMVAW